MVLIIGICAFQFQCGAIKSNVAFIAAPAVVDFNSSVVRLKATLPNLMLDIETNFNSSVVRLKVTKIYK